MDMVMEKFDAKKQRERIHEILDIVLDGNGLGRRKIEETGELPTMFFEFSGHTGTLEVWMYPDGWNYNSKEHMEFDFHSYETIMDAKVNALRYSVAAALEGKEV